MRLNTVFISVTAAVAVVAAACAFTLGAQTAYTIFVANTSRPLATAIGMLERNGGISINYEAPPYQNPGDVSDVSTPEERAARPGFQQLVPRIGNLTAELQSRAPGSSSVADVIFDVNSLLTAYRQSGLPGDFRVEQGNSGLSVVPIRTLGADGSAILVTSPMTSPITIPSAQRIMADTVMAILDAVSKSTGKKIAIGSFPLMPGPLVSFGASNEPARDALARLFAQVGWRQSYRLLFDPKADTHRSFDYMINFQQTGYAPPLAPAGPTDKSP